MDKAELNTLKKMHINALDVFETYAPGDTSMITFLKVVRVRLHNLIERLENQDTEDTLP